MGTSTSKGTVSAMQRMSEGYAENERKREAQRKAAEAKADKKEGESK